MVKFDENAILDGLAVLGGYAGAAAERIPRQGMISGRVSGESGEWATKSRAIFIVRLMFLAG